jgi:uncharacterized protein YrrD
VSSDPVSWKVVERGWKVVAASGEELGTVEEVLGDADADIFHAVMVAHGLLGRTTEVPAERVSEIREGEVFLDGDEL